MKKIILIAIILAGGLFSKAQTCIVDNQSNFSWQMEIYIVQLVPSVPLCPDYKYPHLLSPILGPQTDVVDAGTLTYHASVFVSVDPIGMRCTNPPISGGRCHKNYTNLTALGAPVPPGWTVARVILTKVNPAIPSPLCNVPLASVVIEIPELSGTLNSCNPREAVVINCPSFGDGSFLFQLDHTGNACDQCLDYRQFNGWSGINITHW